MRYLTQHILSFGVKGYMACWLYGRLPVILPIDPHAWVLSHEETGLAF